MKPFSQWTKEDIEDEFGLRAQIDSPLLQQWINISIAPLPSTGSGSGPTFSETDIKYLRQLSRKLLAYVHDWNEEELKIYFIAFLLDFADFYQSSYRPFLERELSVVYAEGKRLWGIVDFMVASGKQTPREPFFFLHEYKKQADSSSDPLGQLLAEMVAAQTANPRPHPIYGAYVIGRHWYFVLLDGPVYAESLAYDATKDEILAIAAILRHTKTLINQLITDG